MYCRQCGFNNDKYSKMCKRCGSDLTRPVEEYRPAQTEPGQLRHAPKQESAAEWIKSRFRRLERAALDRSHLRPFIITAVCAVVAIVLLIAVPRIVACSRVTPDTYGSTACNTATLGAAAVNGDFAYCSLPKGDNPGLYRVKLSTGEALKISWHTLSQVSWYDGWLYGVDETGTLLRISSDGISEQTVIDEKDVHHVSLFNGYVYYIAPGGEICRASLDEVSDETTAQRKVLRDTIASEMIIFDGAIYYIALESYCYEPGLPMEHVIEEGYEPGKISKITGKEIPPEYEVLPAEAEQPVGSVYRMDPDETASDSDKNGKDNGMLIKGKVCNLSAYGDYLYFMTQTEKEVTASTYDHNAPAKVTLKASSCQFWRFNLKTDQYTRFLSEGLSRSPLNVSEYGICYVSVSGNLETCADAGDTSDLLPTGAQSVESFAVIDGVVYYTADGGAVSGWIDINGGTPASLAD